MSLHPAAWAAWTLSAMVLASTTTDPLASTVIIAAIVSVGWVARRPGTGGILKTAGVGILVVALVRIALFTSTGRTGTTVLVRLPEARLPAWLGGFTVGGDLSAEVFAHEAADALRIAGVMLAAIVLAVVSDPTSWIRRMPARLRHLGVLLSVSITFIPSLAAASREVREAQRLRGARIRGPRGALALIIPVLASALDRAANLSESMHARGFHRASPTRMSAAKMSRRERFLAAGCLVVSALAIATAETRAWAAYPSLVFPSFGPATLIGALLLLPLPAMLNAPTLLEPARENA
ncbi:MAG: energy-coupling factor transporter transmembrane component T [Actinomycetota bacterium]